MRRLTLALGLAGLLVGCSASTNGAVSPPTPAIEIPGSVVCQWARVRRVTDGDTIRVDFEDGASNQAVRYIGVDAPETVDPVRGVQPFGPEASAENSRMVSGQRLCLEKDVSETDRYDRLLRYAWLADGTMVNEALVLSGLATVDTFPPDVKYVERFIAAQRDARAARRGMWTN
ncbi:MAG: thermonuclease family protein [bacterium]